MKAIQIKYLSPTNTNGARIKVFAEGCKPLIVAREYALNPVDQYQNLAEDYILRQGWNCEVSGFGQLPNGDYVATLK